MKKQYLTLIILMSCFMQMFSQTPYNKFLVNGAHWKATGSYCDQFAGCDPGQTTPIITHIDYYSYKLEGDTLIDSLLYLKLSQSVLYTCPLCYTFYGTSGPGSQPSSQPYAVIGYMTEDTIARKVYYVQTRNIYNQTCYIQPLPFNFSLNANDTFSLVYSASGNFSNCDTGLIVIDSINYSGFQNYHVKTWYLKNLSLALGSLYPQFALYEGIGYSTGFTVSYNLGDGADLAFVLDSFCIGTDSTCWGSYQVTGIINVEQDRNNVFLYPNPASDMTSIISDGLRVISAEIFNINGRKLYQTDAKIINVTSLSAGVYIINIKTDKGNVPKKLIKF